LALGADAPECPHHRKEGPVTDSNEQLVVSQTLGRIAEPEEVADSVVWLATNQSNYVTGVALPVDGGYLAR
jgi:NAD(P)-dependent dehydrogenase (short-subunit alcohol dehydrogenase family)